MSGRRYADRITDVERARVVSAYRDGVSVDDLAARFGFTARTVRSVLRDGGITLRARRGAA